MTRAKIERYTCDRCGDHQDTENVGQTQSWHEVSFRQPTDNVRRTYDICEACMGDFAAWMLAEGAGDATPCTNPKQSL